MKKLPEHDPKQSAWDDLMKRRDFDSQLSGHLPNLPQYFPKDAAWERITGELDRKKIIPIYIRWGVAAAIASILFLSGITQNWFVGETQPKLNQGYISINKTENQATENQIQPFVTHPDPGIISQKLEKSSSEFSKEKTTPRSEDVIEVPKITLPAIEQSHTSKLSLEIIKMETQVQAPQKTLHQVSISWSKIKPGIQLKTPFGRQESELGQKSQASLDQIGHVILELHN